MADTNNFERIGNTSHNEEEEAGEEGEEEETDNQISNRVYLEAYGSIPDYSEERKIHDEEEDELVCPNWLQFDNHPQCLKEVLCFAMSENICERQVACRALLEPLKLLAESPDDVEKLFGIIVVLSENKEPCIIVELIDHLLPIARFCYEKEQLSYLIASRLVPLLLKFLTASDPQVRKATQECLHVLRTQNFIDQDVVKRDICPVIIDLTRSTQSSPECYSIAISVMTKMAHVLGREATEEFFVPRIISLSMDSAVNVRRMCVANFGEYCSAVNPQVTENILLPCFVKLCHDENWEVRKACAEVIMSVSCACRLETRKSTLAPVCAALLSDRLRAVRMAAFETLGPFITTFAQPSITGLTYNQHGQLVLTNWSGFEFQTTPKDDDMCRKYDEYLGAEVNENEYSPLIERLLNNNSNSNDNGSTSDSEHFSTTLDNDTPSFSGNINPVAQFHYQFSKTFNNSNEVNYGSGNVSINTRYYDCTADMENDNLKQYNTFLYWREPIPSLDDLNIPSTSLTAPSPPTIFPSVNDNSVNHSVISVQSQKLSKDEKEKVTTLPVSDSSNFNNKSNTGDDCNIPLTAGKENKDETTQLIEMIVMQMSNHCLSSEFGSELTYKPSLQISDSNIRQNMPIFKGLSLCRKKVVEKPRQNIVPQELIDHFVSLSDPIQEDCVDDRFLIYQIAYSLPAVAQTLGKENWSLLKNVYLRLAADKTWKVRRAVASSIHELAVIVGEDAATQDLVPVFNDILKDLDDVRIGALKHLAVFLKILRPAGRNSFLPKLAEFLMTDNDTNWRFREELAKQLLQMVGLFSAADTYTHFMPLAILLLLNKVAAVRLVALQLVTELVRWISSDVRLLNNILVELAEQLAHSTHWNRRQTFALLCSRLVSQHVLPEETFATNVLPHLLDISWDAVPNVRLAVARTLYTDIAYNHYFSNPLCPHHEVIMLTLRRLQTDKDRDVRYFACSKPKSISPPASDDGSAQEST
ncbi:serine/threonine-protein phosphatase 4 regulatory subunit 1-like isoform X2 [Lycorma delicatula]|uniref:serine/threonine-protein phosphatase 4 regulatory subunit 1-like isoform X2 n=1 Tax=Lycorma delicatula TaxID=130591 RepID=UPI003F5195C2